MLKNFVKTSSKVVKTSKKLSLNKIQNNVAVFSQKRNYALDEQKKAAVLLAGCGYLDGSEVTEAVSCMIQLQKAGYKVECFSQNKTQEETVDHVSTNVEKNEVRNVEAESARIARKMSPISKLKAEEYSLLVVPGGFGVAKNLSTFAEDDVDFKVDDKVKEVLLDFNENKTPIAFLCIAPVLAANVFGTKNGGSGCKITLGTDKALAKRIESLGVTCELKSVNEVCVDKENNIVSTPAYMEQNASPLNVFEAVGKLVTAASTLRGVAGMTSLTERQLKAIEGFTQGNEEAKLWWIEKIQQGDPKSSGKNYKSTFNDPENWKYQGF